MTISNKTKFILVIGAFVLFFAWQIMSGLLDEYPIVNYPPKGVVAVAIGDSLTLGIGATTPENGFISVLEKRLKATIINKGVGGDTTHDALLRLNTTIASLHPNIVIILLGGNDYLQRIPKAETFANLHSIITTSQSYGATVILLGVGNSLTGDNFANDFTRLARETGSVYVPNVLEGILGDPKLMSDEVHPNDAGYLKIADKVAFSLDALLLAAPENRTK